MEVIVKKAINEIQAILTRIAIVELWIMRGLMMKYVKKEKSRAINNLASAISTLELLVIEVSNPVVLVLLHYLDLRDLVCNLLTFL